MLRNRGADVLVVPAQVPANALADFVATARQMGNVDGIIVTLPHKFAALALCDAVSPRAAAIGAVNLMRLTPSGGWYGDMQDGLGHVAALRQHGCEPAGQRALVIGAGGAGTAIAFALAEAGVCALAIHDTCTDRRDNLIRKLKAHCPVVPELGSSDPTGFDLVVNATPMGMQPGDPLPISVQRLAATTFISDVVTMPAVPPLIAAARKRGCPTMTGTGMCWAWPTTWPRDHKPVKPWPPWLRPTPPRFTACSAPWRPWAYCMNMSSRLRPSHSPPWEIACAPTPSPRSAPGPPSWPNLTAGKPGDICFKA